MADSKRPEGIRQTYRLEKTFFQDIKKGELFITFEDGGILGGSIYEATADGVEDTTGKGSVDAMPLIALVL